MDPVDLEIFAVYYFLAAGAVALMFLRVAILKALLYLTRAFFERLMALNELVRNTTLKYINKINEMATIYFTAGNNDITLNKAALYVMQNELTTGLIVVHVYQDEKNIPPQLVNQLKIIDHLYPRLRIDFLAVKGDFTPSMIEVLSKRLNVPKNYMFIGTPGDRFPHRIETLGGVRVIL